jgi:hypothetical protein
VSGYGALAFALNVRGQVQVEAGSVLSQLEYPSNVFVNALNSTAQQPIETNFGFKIKRRLSFQRQA